MLVPKEVVSGTVCVSAVDNKAVSLPDSQERRVLLYLFSSIQRCGENKKKSDKIIRSSFSRVSVSFLLQQLLKSGKANLLFRLLILRHPLPKSFPLTVQLQPQKQEQSSSKCLHCSSNWDRQSPARRVTSITRSSLSFLKCTVVS